MALYPAYIVISKADTERRNSMMCKLCDNDASRKKYLTISTCENKTQGRGSLPSWWGRVWIPRRLEPSPVSFQTPKAVCFGDLNLVGERIGFSKGKHKAPWVIALVNPGEACLFPLALKQTVRSCCLGLADWKYLRGYYFPTLNRIIICILMES